MAEPLTVSNRALAALLRGLGSLDAIREGECLVGFEFAKDVKWLLMVAAVEAERAFEPYRRMDRKTASKFDIFDGMESSPENARHLSQYNAEMETLRDQEVTIDKMPRFKLDELLNRPCCDDKKVGRMNPIPQSVLVNLAPILEE